MLELILNNVREPIFNRCDLMALVAGSTVGAQRVIELCRRYGAPTYLSAIEVLLARTHDAVARLITHYVSTEPVRFEDYVDDDGRGNGPFRIALSVQRVGEKVVFDFTGTD